MELHLLTEEELERSAIVANCRMNRERGIAGTNSYTADLFLNPLEFLSERRNGDREVAWLDLCCGSGNALIEAARYFQERGMADRISIHGVDLVDLFAPKPLECGHLTLEAASLREWTARTDYDLITCVHGLHYIGDKLGLIARAVSWLKADGLFLGHLDFDNLKLANRQWFGGQLGKYVKRVGLEYHRGRRLLSCRGKHTIDLPWTFAGADETAGPNFTGQPAVDSYYSSPLQAAKSSSSA